jgi:ribonucleases P/MRP protein subunit RPP40
MAPSMFSTNQHPTPKLIVSHGELPPYISPAQPPTKKQPFGTINSVSFIQSTTLVLPEELYQLIISKLDSVSEPCSEDSTPHTNTIIKPKYAKFISPLGHLLENPVLDTLFKLPGSNILALSEGIPGVDNKFNIQKGKLTLDVDRDVYERLGLQGSIIKATGARQHVKNRWRVEVDLRAPSSVGGKKGFDKLRAATGEKGAAGMGKTWMLADAAGLGGGVKLLDEGLQSLHLLVCDALVEEGRGVDGVLVPHSLSRGLVEELDEEDCWALLEWVDLVALDSPRVTQADSVDPYISRYTAPKPNTAGNLRVMKWQGLMSSEWLTRLLIEIIKISRQYKSRDWLAVSVTSHDIEAVGGTDGYTIALQPKAVATETENGLPQEGAEMAEQDGSHQSGGLQQFMCFRLSDSGVS